MNEEEKIGVRLYFVSGKDEVFYYPKEYWEIIEECLRLEWNETCSFVDRCGVNFSTVMYYETGFFK